LRKAPICAARVTRLRLAKIHEAVFYPGGHGPLWDLAEDPTSINLIQSFFAAGRAA
jgi:putative intracellular protease/amidase